MIEAKELTEKRHKNYRQIYRDTTWLSERLLRRAVMYALPPKIMWGMAIARARILGRIRGVPVRIRRNMESVYAEQMEDFEIERMAGQHAFFVNRLAALKSILPRLSQPDTKRYWDVVGLENLDQALAAGRGALLLSAHFGYSKLISPILRGRGYDVRAVVGKTLTAVERESRLERWLVSGSMSKTKSRIHKLLLVNSYEKSCIAAQLDVRPILTALRENKVVMLAGDGLKAAEFSHLPFLDGTYPFAKGFMKIAIMTNTAVLPAFAVDGENGNWINLRIGPALQIEPNASIEENLQKYAQILEEEIRSAPHFWLRWASKDVLEKIGKSPAGRWLDRWNVGIDKLEDD